MNKQFTEEKIKVYASAFRERDAIWCNGKWWEVERYGAVLLAYIEDNNYIINEENNGIYQGIDSGFNSFNAISNNPYRVTTLVDYELSGGEKIVWLGESNSVVTFGKAYTANVNLDKITFEDDTGYSLQISDACWWGVIPTYKQVLANQLQNVEKHDALDDKQN